MKINIPDDINKALNILNDAGYEAYIVGGCVRDAFLGVTANDWDITTSATPDQMKEVFSSFRVIETGIRHGTLSIIIDSEPIEITTMRVDGEYTDNRHPDYVTFTTDIEKDLSRRDFTVNAIAYNPKTGVIDPYNGKSDIKNKTIRCVGDCDKRFNEDALRIMRALRFSSTLEFSIENETADSIIRNKALLRNVASERIRVELLKLLCGNAVKSILLDFSSVFFEVIPELEPMYNFPQNTPYHIYDVWDHTVNAVASIEKDPVLRMVMLLHDTGKPSMHTVDEEGISHFKLHQGVSVEISDKVLKRLRFSKAETEEIKKIILYHDLRPKGENKEIHHLCAEVSPEFLIRLLPVLKADAMAQNPVYLESKLIELDKTKKAIEYLLKTDACFSVTQLKIKGNDLSQLGIEGKQIGQVLKLLLTKVIDEEVDNNYNQLLTYIKENILHN